MPAPDGVAQDDFKTDELKENRQGGRREKSAMREPHELADLPKSCERNTPPNRTSPDSLSAEPLNCLLLETRVGS